MDTKVHSTAFALWQWLDRAQQLCQLTHALRMVCVVGHMLTVSTRSHVRFQRPAGVVKPIEVLTRAIFKAGLQGGSMTEESQALGMAYEVLIHSTRTTSGGDAYDAASVLLSVPDLVRTPRPSVLLATACSNAARHRCA